MSKNGSIKSLKSLNSVSIKNLS
jgi:hypothetical protein